MNWELFSWQALIFLIVGLLCFVFICTGGPRRVLRFLAGVGTLIGCVVAIGALTAAGIALSDYCNHRHEEQLVKARAKTDLEAHDKYRQEHGDKGMIPDEYIDWEATARDELEKEGKIHPKHSPPSN